MATCFGPSDHHLAILQKLHLCISRAQVKVGLRLERRYYQRWNFAISTGDGSVCHEIFGIHSIAAVCC
jgi:hypothetical protein